MQNRGQSGHAVPRSAGIINNNNNIIIIIIRPTSELSLTAPHTKDESEVLAQLVLHRHESQFAFIMKMRASVTIISRLSAFERKFFFEERVTADQHAIDVQTLPM